MTRISFFHGANDRLHAAAHWVAEAHRKSMSVLIYTPREEDRKSTRLNSSHIQKSRMPSSA